MLFLLVVSEHLLMKGDHDIVILGKSFKGLQKANQLGVSNGREEEGRELVPLHQGEESFMGSHYHAWTCSYLVSK